MTRFLHERLVLDGPSRPIHFLIFKNHVEEKSFLSFSSSSPIRRLDQENYKLLLQRRRVGKALSMRHQSHAVYDHGGSTTH